jgi:hypothetical protein
MRSSRFTLAAFISAALAFPAVGEPAEPESLAFYPLATMPIRFQYLDQPSVRAELHLTQNQIAKLSGLQKKWKELAFNERLKGESVDARNEEMRDIPKKIADVLTDAQNVRFVQIMNRHVEREYGLPTLLARLANDLDLSREQRERFELLRRGRAETILEHLTSGEGFKAVRLKVYEANAEHAEAFNKVLGNEQQAKLKTLLGEPFVGELRLGEPVVSESRPYGPIFRGKLFGFYAFEAEYLINESVQKELQMTDAQIRRAKEFHVEWSNLFAEGKKSTPDPADVLQSLHPFVKDQLKIVLEKWAQRERFLSIMVQHRANVAGPAAACGYPEVLEALSLDAKKQKAFRAAPSMSLLNGAQLDLYGRIAGLPFKGEVTIKNPLAALRGAEKRIARPAPIPLDDLTKYTLAGYMVENARRFKLTDEQVARLKEIADDAPKCRHLLNKELSNLPPATEVMTVRACLPEAKAVELYRKAITEQCLEILDDKQRSLFGAELQKAARDY